MPRRFKLDPLFAVKRIVNIPQEVGSVALWSYPYARTIKDGGRTPHVDASFVDPMEAEEFTIAVPTNGYDTHYLKSSFGFGQHSNMHQLEIVKQDGKPGAIFIRKTNLDPYTDIEEEKPPKTEHFAFDDENKVTKEHLDELIQLRDKLLRLRPLGRKAEIERFLKTRAELLAVIKSALPKRRTDLG